MNEGSQGSPSQQDIASNGESSSVFDDVAALIDDGRTLVEAELAYQKTRLSYAGRRGRNAAIFGAIAAVLAIFAVFGLVVGAILALTPHWGAWGATAAVVGILLAIAAICAIAAAHNAKMIARAFKDTD